MAVGSAKPAPFHALRWNLAIFGALALWVVVLGNPLESVERSWLDQSLRWRAELGWTPPADPRVMILGIDDVDMAELPSIENEYAAAGEVIRQASELGAAVIVFDTIYLRGGAAMAAPILTALDSGGPVVFGEALQVSPGSERVQRLRSFPFRSHRQMPAGVLNITADPDGGHRSYPLLYWDGETYEPSLSVAAWFAARGLAWNEDVKQPSPGVMQWHDLSKDGSHVETRAIADGASMLRLLNFRGSWSSGAGFRHLSLRELREVHATERERGGQPLAGFIVFVANTATGIADVGKTAFGTNQPLVLLHATALNDLLQNSFLRRIPRWADALMVLAAPLLAGASALCARKRSLLVLWVAGVSAILGLGFLSLLKVGIVLPVVTVAALWTLALIFELARRHTSEFIERQRVRAAMGLYFSPRVLEDVLAHPGRLEPKRVKITVLLTDLRNSTPLAERLGTEGMLELLNRVFEVENRAVFDEDGSLEKPVGDQFLAYWGAPDPQPDAADRALRAALTLIDRLEALRETLDPPIRELFGYGVALHAGSSLIANIGSAQFFHYGVVGDLINATARIESLTKQYGVRILVSREVLDKFSAPPSARLLDRVIVKGKSTPLDLFEIAHPRGRPDFAEHAVRYTEAFDCYQRGDFSHAAELFGKLAPDDPASDLLARRCMALAAAPPRDWQGVFKLETK